MEADDGLVAIGRLKSRNMTPRLHEGAAYARVELDGLPVAGDGLVQLALVLQRIAQVVVGHGGLRVEFDGLAEADDGRVVIAA